MSKKKTASVAETATWFTVEPRALREALQLLRTVAPQRSTLLVLSHVLVKTTTNAVVLTATDLSTTLTLVVPARVETPDTALTLPARTFGDWLNTQPPAESLTARLIPASATAELSVGRAMARIKGIAAEEFPAPLPHPTDATTITLDAAAFAHSVRRVAFTAAPDEVRPVLSGVFVRVADNELTLAAADGVQLAVERLPLNAPATPAEGIIPPDALELAAKLTERAESSAPASAPAVVADAGVALVLSATQVRFQVAGDEVVASLIEGTYPQIERIIPTTYTSRATFETAPIAATLKAAATLSEDGVELSFTPEGLTFAGITPETDVVAQVPLKEAAGIGESPFRTRVQIKFLRRVAAALADVDEMGFEWGPDPHMPVVLYAPAAPTWKYVVMPLAQ